MTVTTAPVLALDIAPRATPSTYPAQFAHRVTGRVKRALGDAFGLTRYGINLTILAPGAQSALLHRHTDQQEFIYVLAGRPTLRTDDGEAQLEPGMCIGFLPNGNAHHLINCCDEDVHYLEIGDRSEADRGEFPEDDLIAQRDAGAWTYTHRDGSPW
jgi:uncharacterized cupin superfamily protein